VSTPAQAPGGTLIEIVIALSLFGIAFVGLAGLHMVALSAGTAAETASIATNLARARMEELLALPPAQIIGQNDVQTVEEIPGNRGRTYTVHTMVDSSNSARLDITVTATSHVTYGSACASGSPSCVGTTVTLTRTLRTRIKRS